MGRKGKGTGLQTALIKFCLVSGNHGVPSADIIFSLVACAAELSIRLIGPEGTRKYFADVALSLDDQYCVDEPH